MIYLSRLFLDPRAHPVRRDLQNCHDLHRTVMAAFGDVSGAAARAGLDVLFRLEPERRDHPMLLVQSGTEPDWETLPSGYLAQVVVPNPSVREVGATYEQVIAAGRSFRFRLRANPTRKIASFDAAGARKKNGTRVPVRDDEARIEWLRRKGTDGGFELLNTRLDAHVADVTGRDDVRPVTGWKAGAAKLTFEGVTFDGRLRVTDPARFMAVLRGGVGSAKAYGFGLVSIAM